MMPVIPAAAAPDANVAIMETPDVAVLVDIAIAPMVPMPISGASIGRQQQERRNGGQTELSEAT
jgi:hypothetical protein